MSYPVLAILLAAAVIVAVFAYRRLSYKPEVNPRKRVDPDQVFKM